MSRTLHLTTRRSPIASGLSHRGVAQVLATIYLCFGAGFAASADPPQGSIVAWGENDTVPLPNAGFIAVEPRVTGSLGLKADGSILVWGGDESVPPPNTGFVAITADSHVLALKADGSIVAWGCGWPNSHGQCNVPAPNTGFIAVDAGSYHSIGLKADGSIVAWGCLGENRGQCSIPVPNAGFVAIAAGQYHNLGLKADGTVVAWGLDASGALDVSAPNNGFVAVAAGYGHSLAVRANGNIASWGYNGSGQTTVPAPNTGFVAVDARGHRSLGRKADGSIVAWGSPGNSGQLDVPLPNSGYFAASVGNWHSLALKATGPPACCNPDVNGSGGTINIIDLALVVDCVKGYSNSPACDINCDGSLDLCDLLLVECAVLRPSTWPITCCNVERCGTCRFTGRVCSNSPKVPCLIDDDCNGQPCGWPGAQSLATWESDVGGGERAYSCNSPLLNGTWQPTAPRPAPNVPLKGGPPPTPDLAGVANPPPQKTGLVVVTHGHRDNAYVGGWAANMADSIAAAIPPNDATNWRVVPFDWSQGANNWLWQPEASIANGQTIGRRLGQYMNTQGYSRVHFYAHSAGSHLIDEAEKQLADVPTTQLTFFDSFVPGTLSESPLGTTATFAMQYADTRELSLPVYSYTAEVFPGAYHLSVTDLDYRGLSPINYNFPEFHRWPYIFYQHTIDEHPCGLAQMPPWQAAALGWGFDAAMECNAGTVPSHATYPKGDADSASGPSPRRGVGDPDDRPQITYELPIDFAASFVNHQNAVMSANQVTLVASAGDTAAWINFEVVTSQPVNHLQFTYEFDSDLVYGAPGESWFAAYVDRDENDELTDHDLLFQVDELTASRVASKDNPTNNYVYSYTKSVSLGQTLPPGTHLIAFRLDTYEQTEPAITGDQSSLVLSNVALGGAFCPGASADPACDGVIVGGDGACGAGYSCSYADATCTCIADAPPIPAVSQWGWLVLALLTCSAGTLIVKRAQRVH